MVMWSQPVRAAAEAISRMKAKRRMLRSERRRRVSDCLNEGVI
jgi:hypothetical protein